MKRNLTCIICPKGCSLTVEGEVGQLTVFGNTCKRGEQYAIDECTHPMRTVTSSIRVSNRENTMVSVKTADVVAKESIFEVMKQIRAAQIPAPIQAGDVLLHGVCGTDLIATKTIA